MERLEEKYFMMFEPDQQGSPSIEPIKDELTHKVDTIYAACTPSKYNYKGFHITKCGKTSDNRDWILPNGMITHSLTGYYIRHYREFFPSSEIEKIERIYQELQEAK